jgi:hypothetical protein
MNRAGSAHNWRKVRGLLGIRLGVLGFALFIFGFLALRSSPYLTEVLWIPRWLASWSDANGVIRNPPAFAALYILCVICLGWSCRHWLLLLTCGLAIALEVGQLWLPERVADWRDVMASWVGALAGYGLVMLIWRQILKTDNRRKTGSRL